MIKFNRDYQYKAVSPCKGCKDRSPTCHGECEKYIEFQKQLDYEKEERRNKRIYEGYKH